MNTNVLVKEYACLVNESNHIVFLTHYTTDNIVLCKLIFDCNSMNSDKRYTCLGNITFLAYVKGGSIPEFVELN